MCYAKGIRSGETIDPGFQQMAMTRCYRCFAEYIILHDRYNIDPAKAQRQARWLAEYLVGEHVDDKFVKHLPVYEDLRVFPES